MDDIRSLYPHQVAGIRKALPVLQNTGGFYLLHDPGLGKTLTALVTAKALGVRRILVVCQAVGLGVWTRAVKRWLPGTPLTVVRGDGAFPTYEGDGVYLTNYGQLMGTRDNGRWRYLKARRPELVIADEAHTINGPSGRQGAAVRLLAKHTGAMKLLLSGTIAHDAAGYWAPFHWICPEVFPFDKNFATGKIDTDGNIIPGYEEWMFVMGGPDGNWRLKVKQDNLDRAKAAMMPYVHIAKTEERDWPAPVWNRLEVELGAYEMNAYRDMDSIRMIDARGVQAAADLVITKLLRLSQITGGFVTTTDGKSTPIGTSKLDALMTLLEERRDRKTVVACAFLAELDAIQFELEQRKILFGRIDGSVSPEQRGQFEMWFNDECDRGVMLLQYKSGGTSISLTAAHTLILYSMLPSVIGYRQMIGRVWREGQTKHVEILALLAKGTRDERLLDGLQAGLESVDLYNYTGVG